MTTIQKLTLLCLPMALAAIPALAQGWGPPDPQEMQKMRINFLTRELNLSADQVTKATKIYGDASTAGESIRASLQSNRSALQDAVTKNDPATIDQLAATNGKLTGQLLAIDSKADALFYSTLSADQQASFDQISQRGPGGRGMMGPEGFGGRQGRGGPRQ